MAGIVEFSEMGCRCRASLMGRFTALQPSAQRSARQTRRHRAPRLCSLRFQPAQVTEQLLLIGHAAEVPADHFVRPQSRFASRPQTDQHTGNDRTVRLNFDAILRMAQQVAAAQHVLEEAEENLDCPAIVVQQSNDFRRHICQVGSDPKDAVTVLTC